MFYLKNKMYTGVFVFDSHTQRNYIKKKSPTREYFDCETKKSSETKLKFNYVNVIPHETKINFFIVYFNNISCY